MNLIEKLGVEKCKQIVDGAPDQTASYYMYDTYFKSQNPVEWFYWEENQWKFTSHSKRFENFLISLKDLRTALADHDRIDTCTDIKNHISPNTVVIDQ